MTHEHPVTAANYDILSDALDYFEKNASRIRNDLREAPLILHYGRYQWVCVEDSDLDDFLLSLRTRLKAFKAGD